MADFADARIPPQSVEAEKAVLGALLTSEDAADSVMSLLKSEDFFRDPHRIIFEALQNILRVNKRADIVLLTDELERMKKLDQVGGVAYIASLTNEVSVLYNVEEHARIIAEKAQLRRLIDAGNKIVGMTYDEAETPKEIVNKAERMILDVSGQTASESTFSSLADIVPASINRLNEIQQQPDGLTGLNTGFRDLNELTNGLQPSDLILIAARPAMGKTAFTLNLAQNIAIKSGKVVAFFSLEMSKEQLVGRILSSVSGVSSEKLRRADLAPQEWDAVLEAGATMSEAPLFIDDTPGLTVQMMRSKLRRLKVEKGGLDLVIVDYIQLMQGSSSGRSNENRQQEISDISRNLKLIAREFNIPLIALSQLSRAVEQRPDKRPVLSDLRESGSLEQDADIVAFLYRDKYYDENSEKGDITEVLFKKNRHGATDKVELYFDGNLTRFKDVSYKHKDKDAQ